MIYQKSESEGDSSRQCLSAVSGDQDDMDDDFSGDRLELRECDYNLESSVGQGQYWRMLLLYPYPVVTLVTATK